MAAGTTVVAQREELHHQIAAAAALVESADLWSTLMVAVTTMGSMEHVGA